MHGRDDGYLYLHMSHRRVACSNIQYLIPYLCIVELKTMGKNIGNGLLSDGSNIQ